MNVECESDDCKVKLKHECRSWLKGRFRPSHLSREISILHTYDSQDIRKSEKMFPACFGLTVVYCVPIERELYEIFRLTLNFNPLWRLFRQQHLKLKSRVLRCLNLKSLVRVQVRAHFRERPELKLTIYSNYQGKFLMNRSLKGSSSTSNIYFHSRISLFNWIKF